MKKIINILFAVCMLFSAFSVYAEDGIDAGAGVPEAYYGTPKIDGDKDAAYTLASALTIEHILEENTTVTDGSTAKVWLLWDYEALYVYAEVAEKTPACASQADYNNDSVEIFIDENNSASTDVDADDQQFRIASRGTKTQGLSAPGSWTGVAKENADGTYTVEFKIEWVRILPADGMVIGFDAQVNDGDENGKRISCTSWYSDSPENYVNSVHYGDIVLKMGENYPKWDGSTPLKVSLNGIKIDYDVEPVVINDRTLVPMRKTFESLGAGVAWNQDEQAAYAIGNGKLMIMPVGSNVVKVNGEDVTSDVPIQIINDRTLVPLRFVSELLGADVKYDGVQGMVFIKK